MTKSEQQSTTQSNSALRPHDVGGKDGGPIDIVDHGTSHWEKHANALRMAVTGISELGTLDEMRRVCEDMGAHYYEIGYFERQTEALAIILAERGIITDQMLRARMADVERRFAATPKIGLPEQGEHHPHDHDGKAEEWKEDETGEGYGEHHLMNLAIQELLQEQGWITPDNVRAMIESFDDEFPDRGAKIVVRAWMDPNFKTRLLGDARPAIEEMAIDLGFQARIIALENTPDVHNVVVCTLCSCYPRFLLGQPPTWYKSRSYRSRVIHEPRAVLKEFGTQIPDDVTIKVHDSNADMRYLVVPMRPQGTENWSARELEAIITRDALVGVSLPAAKRR